MRIITKNAFFLQVFSHFIAKCAKTHAKSRIFTKIKITHYYKCNCKTHLKSWNALQKGHKQWSKWYFHSGTGSKTFSKKLKFLTKTLFLQIFCLFVKKCVKTLANCSNLNKKQNSRHWLNFPKIERKSSSMSRNAVFARILP